MKAADVLKQLIEGNHKYAVNKANEEFKSIQSKQEPQVTMVACSDSRISGHIFNLDTTNYVFLIRNIGNQIATAEGSIDYGVLHLKTPILLIMGHTGCGAVHAALGDYAKEPETIKKELDTLKPSLTIPEKETKSLAEEAKQSQANVDSQVDLAVNKYREQVKKGDIIVVGAMFDFHDIYSENRGEIIITNINNEKDTGRIRKLRVLEGISDSLKELKVKRI